MYLKETNILDGLRKILTRERIEDVPFEQRFSLYQDKETAKEIIQEGFVGIAAKDTMKEVDLIEELLALRKGAKILDVCCGYGRHSIELAKRGYQIVGVDITEDFIKHAQDLATELGIPASFLQKDVLEITFVDEFDGAFVAFNSLSLFTGEDCQKLLEKVHDALHLGGKFFCDLENRDYIGRYESTGKTWFLHKNSIILHEVYFDPKTNISKCRDTEISVKTGGVKEFIQTTRVYTFTEFRKMLTCAGFEPLSVYGDWNRAEFNIESPKMIILAKKLLHVEGVNHQEG